MAATSENKVTITPGKTIKLTPQQRTAWDMTRASLLWNCPHFTHVFFTMMAQGDDCAVFTDEIPIAATDGKYIFINPDPFFKHSINERVFVLAHEISHGMFSHCATMQKLKRSGSVVTSSGKKLPYDHQKMNIAMDLMINDLLIESGVGKFWPGGMHDKKYGTYGDSVIDIYEKVFKDEKGGPGGDSFDEHLAPGSGSGSDPDKAAQDNNQVEWDMAIAAGAAAAKAVGKLPAALERMMGQLVEPVVSWQEKIQAFFARKVGSGSYDWRRPDRCMIVRDDPIYAPGQSGFGAGNICIAIDTSGSIGQTELDQFFAEMRSILEDVRPRKVYVVWCDSNIGGIDEIEEPEDVGGLKPKGGGGTSFVPPFQWAETEGIELDALVYFTDLYGPFPDWVPKFPVIWASTTPNMTVPFGDYVDVPLKPR